MEDSTTANRARWIAAVRGGKSKKAGGGEHKSGLCSGGSETKQSVPCLPARACACLVLWGWENVPCRCLE